MEAMTHWQVGELARQTGLSIRTLHYYDELGLLVPSERTEAGYRLYTRADLSRLQQILSLRRLGFSLAQIGKCLRDRRLAPREILRLHIDRLQQEIELRQETLGRLKTLAGRMEEQKEISGEEFIRVMEVMTMEQLMEKYFSPEQLAFLRERQEALGGECCRDDSQWSGLIAQLKAEMDKGTPPEAEHVRALARRSCELFEKFTGNDDGIAKSFSTMFRENPEAVTACCGMDEKVCDYITQACGCGCKE